MTLSDSAKHRFGIVFVCTGNYCRSPMAESVMRALICRRKLEDQFQVTSAALAQHHLGKPADPRAIAAAKRRGYPWTHQRARGIDWSDRGVDLLVGMGPWHSDRLSEVAPPQFTSRIRSLPSYGRTGVREIPDPFHGSEKDFEHALDLIEVSCAALLSDLRPLGIPLRFSVPG